jgi:hypothetical protein
MEDVLGGTGIAYVVGLHGGARGVFEMSKISMTGGTLKRRSSRAAGDEVKF